MPAPFTAPAGIELPRALAMPGDDGTPHPIAAVALAGLVQRLRDDPRPAGFDLDGPHGGKMFGALVVEHADATLGVLHAFSGRLGRTWLADGFVPPVFDFDEVAAFWPAGEAEVDAMTEAVATSHGDARRDLVRRRRALSRALWARFVACYRIADAHGHVRTVPELFAPRTAPGGAGDCAAPKLIARAYALGLRPVALGEVWWGASIGPRHAGTTWPPCVSKCGPVLAHMLGRG